MEAKASAPASTRPHTYIPDLILPQTSSSRTRPPYAITSLINSSLPLPFFSHAPHLTPIPLPPSTLSLRFQIRPPKHASRLTRSALALLASIPVLVNWAIHLLARR